MDHYTALVLSDVGRRSEDSEEESSVINDCNIIQQSRSQEEEECEGLRPILLLLSRDQE